MEYLVEGSACLGVRMMKISLCFRDQAGSIFETRPLRVYGLGLANPKP